MLQSYQYICQDIVDKSSPWNSESASHARSLQLALLVLHSPFPLVFPFVALSITSVALSPEVFQVSLDCIFPTCFRSSSLPFPCIFVLNTFLSVCFSSLLVTCPYQFDILSAIFLEACTTLVVPRKCSFLILSWLVIPCIHLSILISFTLILFSNRFVVVNVSAS